MPDQSRQRYTTDTAATHLLPHQHWVPPPNWAVIAPVRVAATLTCHLASLLARLANRDVWRNCGWTAKSDISRCNDLTGPQVREAWKKVSREHERAQIISRDSV